MAHRVFTGPFAALEGRWLEEAARLQKDDPLAPVTVLVGSNLLATYLKGRVAERGRAAANLRFCTFLDLSRSLGQFPAGGDHKPRLPHLGASAILESLLASQAPSVFRAVTGYAGFRDALLDTFRDLRDAGVTPNDLDEGVRRCIVDAPDRRDHLSGLSLLYRLFRARVEQFHGVDEDFQAAMRNARQAPKVLGCRQLHIYGIYDVTGQQSDLLAGLKDALEMVYFIPFVDDAVSAFARPFLRAREQELGVDAVLLAVDEPANDLGKLRQWHLGFGMPELRSGESGSAERRPLTDDGSFALVSAPGESRTAVEIVREVLRAVHDGVIAGFHEAAVVLRQPEAEVPILTEAFRLRHIPYFVEGGTPFAQRPLARAVMALAGLESESFSWQAILKAMEWISAALPTDSAPSWDVAEWRALANQPRFLAGVRSWDEGTEGLIREAMRDLRGAEARAAAPDQEEEDDRRSALSVPAAQRRLSAARALRQGWEHIRQAASAWPDAASWRDWAQLLQQRLEPLFKTAGDWPAFSTVLDEIGSLTDMTGKAGIDPSVSRAKLAAALQESLASLSCPEGRFMRRGVNLISAGAARGLRFPLVIVSGLEEGRFPARLRQDPLLLDAERRKIGYPPRLPLKSLRGEEEKLLFDMAARSAERRLVLLTSRLDEGSDRERIPSEFFLRAAAAARGKPVGLRDLAEGIIPGFRSVSLENPAPPANQVAVDKGEIRLRLVTGSSVSARAALSALAREEPQLLNGPLSYDESRWLPRLTRFDGRLSDPALVRRVAGTVGPAAGPVSASGLEEYAKCPYLFYLRRVMGLVAWEEQEIPLALDPLERGQLVHAILEKFLSERTGEVFAAASMEELQTALLAHARPALDDACPAGMPDLLWDIEREALERLLRNWVEFEKARLGSGLLPAYLELPFGKFSPKESYAELRLKAGEHEFIFRGRIDRIDLARDGKQARVIDYKTGNLPKPMEKELRPLLMAGERMQVAIYRCALSLLDGLKQVGGIEGEYLHLQPKDGAVVECAFDEEQLKEACSRLPQVLEILGDGIERGVFFARTNGTVRPDGHCKYCDYLTICGKDRGQREERKAVDPAVLRFQQLVQIDQPMEKPE
jgi:CRISPR/Cas system-associated exonuclease Cas4 (RecB family)